MNPHAAGKRVIPIPLMCFSQTQSLHYTVAISGCSLSDQSVVMFNSNVSILPISFIRLNSESWSLLLVV